MIGEGLEEIFQNGVALVCLIVRRSVLLNLGNRGRGIGKEKEEKARDMNCLIDRHWIQSSLLTICRFHRYQAKLKTAPLVTQAVTTAVRSLQSKHTTTIYTLSHAQNNLTKPHRSSSAPATSSPNKPSSASASKSTISLAQAEWPPTAEVPSLSLTQIPQISPY